VQNDHLSPEDLAAYVDGALSPAERARVEGHLIGCRTCLSELTAVLREIRGWGEQRPD
jgi:anti-sigma factor RsiW